MIYYLFNIAIIGDLEIFSRSFKLFQLYESVSGYWHAKQLYRSGPVGEGDDHLLPSWRA